MATYRYHPAAKVRCWQINKQYCRPQIRVAVTCAQGTGKLEKFYQTDFGSKTH